MAVGVLNPLKRLRIAPPPLNTPLKQGVNTRRTRCWSTRLAPSHHLRRCGSKALPSWRLRFFRADAEHDGWTPSLGGDASVISAAFAAQTGFPGEAVGQAMKNKAKGDEGCHPKKKVDRIH